MGIHRARIDFVTERRIGIVGRSRGDRVSVRWEDHDEVSIPLFERDAA